MLVCGNRAAYLQCHTDLQLIAIRTAGTSTVGAELWHTFLPPLGGSTNQQNAGMTLRNIAGQNNLLLYV